MDTFPIDDFENKQISHFQINYLAETNFGEEVEIHRAKEGETCWHELKRKTDGVVCRTKTVWGK